MSAAADLILRDARPEEREAVAALTRTAYAEYAAVMTPSAWAGLDGAVRAALDAEEGFETIVAEQGGALVGCVRLYPPASDAYGVRAAQAGRPELRLLAVAPGARGRGIGRALVRECVRRARLAGATELGLHTSESMAAAVCLYTRMGFTRAPEHDFQPPGAERVEAYRLSLPGPDPEG